MSFSSHEMMTAPAIDGRSRARGIARNLTSSSIFRLVIKVGSPPRGDAFLEGPSSPSETFFWLRADDPIRRSNTRSEQACRCRWRQ